MSGVHLRQFHFDDIGSAAILLAQRHRRDRERLPLLSPTFEEPGECVTLLRRSFERDPHLLAVAALAGSELAGYIFAETQLVAPTSHEAQYIAPYTLSIGLHAHAVAQGHDATDLYRLMYANVAARAVAQGFFHHRVNIVPGDRDVEEAWVNLGFGRALTCAIRDTGPVAGAAAAGIEVHPAAGEDIDVIMALETTNERHHYDAPICWPLLHVTAPAAREYHVRLLEDPAANAHFVAYREGRPMGMTTFNPPDWLSPLVLGAPTVYLYQGVVEAEARGAGIGTALLGEGMAWARDRGYDQCALHYASANPSGAPFWLAHGFVPVEHSMARHIDERVAWARP